MVAASSLLVSALIPDKSAPAAKINGLPVTAIAVGFIARAWSIAALILRIDCGPSVVGRVWSKPLSMVIKANFPLAPKAVKSTSRISALVTTSSA